MAAGTITIIIICESKRLSMSAICPQICSSLWQATTWDMRLDYGLRLFHKDARVAKTSRDQGARLSGRLG